MKKFNTKISSFYLPSSKTTDGERSKGVKVDPKLVKQMDDILRKLK